MDVCALCSLFFVGESERTETFVRSSYLIPKLYSSRADSPGIPTDAGKYRNCVKALTAPFSFHFVHLARHPRILASYTREREGGLTWNKQEKRNDYKNANICPDVILLFRPAARENGETFFSRITDIRRQCIGVYS